MNPITSLWYGVDALTEKYPTIGGYVYCAGNSVRLIDPDGKAIHVANKTSYEILLSYCKKTYLSEEEMEWINIYGKKENILFSDGLSIDTFAFIKKIFLIRCTFQLQT